MTSPPTPPTSTSDSEYLRAYLADHDFPCPICSYNLRGLQTGRCPECNETLRLTIASDGETRLHLLVGTIVSLGIVAGMSGVLLIFILAWSYMRNAFPPSRDRWPTLYYPVIALAVNVPLAWWLSRRSGRRWFRTRSVSWQHGLRLAAITASAATIGGWMILVWG